MVSGRLIDVLRNGGGAHKGQRPHIGVSQQAVNGHLVALEHVEHAIGQARLLQQLGHQQRG